MNTKTERTPVIKRITLDGTSVQVFALFTEDIPQWWTLATHSVGQGDAVTCAIDPRVGGRLFETGMTRAGTACWPVTWRRGDGGRDNG